MDNYIGVYKIKITELKLQVISSMYTRRKTSFKLDNYISVFKIKITEPKLQVISYMYTNNP